MDNICKTCGNNIADYGCAIECGKAAWDKKVAVTPKPKPKPKKKK